MSIIAAGTVMIGLLNRITEPFLPVEDISGEKLLAHLRNIGVDAEAISTGSVDDPGIESPWRHGEPKYSFSIRTAMLKISR